MTETTQTRKPRSKNKGSQDIALGIPADTPVVIRTAIRKSNLSYDAYVRAITANALSELVSWTSSDLERLLSTASLHGLDPLNREIFMLPNIGDAPPLIAVGVDGWAKVMNAHPQFSGMLFIESVEQINNIPLWIECEIHRHDRVVPLKVREYFEEARSEHMAWLTHPRRMLRHKCMVQCARLAFGLSGIYDSDEAMRIRQPRGRAKAEFIKKNSAQERGVAALTQQVEKLITGG